MAAAFGWNGESYGMRSAASMPASDPCDKRIKPAKVAQILVGGMFGIACILLATPIVGALAPVIGLEYGTLVFILAIVFAIVALGEMLPLLFNNYAFMYLTVAGIAVHAPEPNPYLWIAVTGIGGALLIAGVIGIGKLMSRTVAAG